MAKTPQIDYFDITFRIPSDDMGRMIVYASQGGYHSPRIEHVTEVHRFKQRANHDIKAEDFLQAWTQEHVTFKAIEAVGYFREHGRTDGACYTSLRVLCDKKILRKLGPGSYQLANMKALPAPSAKRDHFEVNHRDFILRIGRAHHGRFTLEQVRDRFAKDGRKKASISGAVGNLVEKKMIKAIRPGEYQLLAKAKKEGNSHGEAQVTETAHAQG